MAACSIISEQVKHIKLKHSTRDLSTLLIALTQYSRAHLSNPTVSLVGVWRGGKAPSLKVFFIENEHTKVKIYALY